MTQYFDCLVWKEAANGKKFARQIGSAKPRDDGGFAVYLDALPTDGKFTISPQRPRDGGGAATKRPEDLEDTIPF